MTDSETSPLTEPLPKRDHTWPIVGGLFLAFWVVYLLVASPRAPEEIDLAAPGKPADYNWTLHDLDGQPVKFTNYAGKAVFLNIWATWCPPCIGEMPSIARLAGDARFQGKNIAFVCVATDDSIETVRKFVRDKQWPMTILHADGLPGVFLTDGIPATFIIAPDGRVVATTVGSHDWDRPEVVKSLEAVAAVPPKSPAPAGS
ncbi:TlpA family protein disulfide reductase [Paludisphaera borealis]|uniref:Thiol-disulfide oxidoreductase ResA n=1 Tax=Paludisphaera borealis TaxID=1387353 RepID=A0A1U7CLY0_9BACT|nr:TlpA disulfide reductase family protein [Paludisphaera borealis]APW59945.1 Thiol-disulfide oxidoreductase ResA [Paludisphaera borealis]